MTGPRSGPSDEPSADDPRSGALPPEDEREVPEPGRALGAGEDERVGIFPSWRWLYATVVVYAALVVALLYVFTLALDFGAR